ncbi:MAG: hypothetical protein ACR2QM_06455 [Longimicrobiales bacterium]
MAQAPRGDEEAPRIDPASITIKGIETPEEFEACVVIQKDTWGQDFSDVVPVSMLQISAKMGGVVSGAFNPGGELIGVVYGITGIRDGVLAHWSHMLAVRDDARNLGLGRRLKLHQRAFLKGLNVQHMYWTYDPLVARNAHLNLTRLGASIDEYVVDMYGDSDSELHRLGTDRFIVKWDLNRMLPAKGSGPADRAPASTGSLPRFDRAFGFEGAPEPTNAPAVEVVIPLEIDAVEARSFDEALEWRASTRRAFVHYLASGYEVTEFVPGAVEAHYVLTRAQH